MGDCVREEGEVSLITGDAGVVFGMDAGEWAQLARIRNPRVKGRRFGNPSNDEVTKVLTLILIILTICLS